VSDNDRHAETQNNSRPDQREHQQDQRKKRGSGLCRRVMLDLNEIKWKEKQNATERRVEQERMKVSAAITL